MTSSRNSPIYFLGGEMTLSWTLPCYKDFIVVWKMQEWLLHSLSLYTLSWKIFMCICVIWTNMNYIYFCSQFQHYRYIGKWSGNLVYLLFSVSCFQNQLVLWPSGRVSVMIFVTIWSTHGIIDLLSLYKLMYSFIGGLLYHVQNDLCFRWSNTLLSHIGTIAPLLFDL